MLTYTVIVSPGYYADRGGYPFVIMFAVLLVLTLTLIVVSVVRRDEL